MQSFSLRRDQAQYLHDILAKGLDLINEEDGDRDVERPRRGWTSGQFDSEMEGTERPTMEAYLGSSVKTERPSDYEDPYLARKRHEESLKFVQQPLEPYIEHATDGLATEITEVQTRMKILQSQLQGSSRPQLDSYSPQEPKVTINPPMTLQELYESPIPFPKSDGEKPQKREIPAGKPTKPPQIDAEIDVNDYSLPELERLKWLLMEEKRKQEKLTRENTKLDTRIKFRIDMEKKLTEMKAMVSSLQQSVQNSQHLRKRQKDLITVIQFQIDKNTLKNVGEKYPNYVRSLGRHGRKPHRKRAPSRSIIQHGRIAASRP